MQLLPRIRTTLARHPLLWWAAVGALAVLCGVLAAGALRRVDEARASWGTTRVVWVASAAAAPGDALVAERREYPVAMVPASAVTSSPAGAMARERIAGGEVIVAGHISLGGVAGLVPTGSVGVAVPLRSPQLHTGDGVAAFANGQRLADGIVVRIDDDQVVLAIPADAAPGLTMAVPAGAVVLALLPPPVPGS